jgi:hypothetical protein
MHNGPFLQENFCDIALDDAVKHTLAQAYQATLYLA